jgi:hypothetical protein
MATPVENLDYELLGDDSGGAVYQKIQGMLAKLKELVVLYNAQIQDEGSIAVLIADLQLYLDNYEGVASVNGKTGVAVLTSSDVGALPSGGTAENSLRLGGVVAAGFYHTESKPTKGDVGLPNAVNDNPVVTVLDPGTATINRTAIMTFIVRLSAADVAYTLNAPGFAVGDKVFLIKAIPAGTIQMITSTQSITLLKKGTSAASQTLQKPGTICFEKTLTGWLARAA